MRETIGFLIISLPFILLLIFMLFTPVWAVSVFIIAVATCTIVGMKVMGL